MADPIKTSYDSILSIGGIEYGIINGNGPLILIKTGKGGSVYGYENKYLDASILINKEFGYPVVCASNPVETTSDTFTDIIEKAAQNEIPIYFIGISDGALQGAQKACRYPNIQKMLLINCPLMINWHRTKEGLTNFCREDVTLVFGSEDPSSRFVPFVSNLTNSNLTVKIIDGEDHLLSKGICGLSEIVMNYLQEHV